MIKLLFKKLKIKIYEIDSDIKLSKLGEDYLPGEKIVYYDLLNWGFAKLELLLFSLEAKKIYLFEVSRKVNLIMDLTNWMDKFNFDSRTGSSFYYFDEILNVKSKDKIADFLQLAEIENVGIVNYNEKLYEQMKTYMNLSIRNKVIENLERVSPKEEIKTMVIKSEANPVLYIGMIKIDEEYKALILNEKEYSDSEPVFDMTVKKRYLYPIKFAILLFLLSASYAYEIDNMAYREFHKNLFSNSDTYYYHKMGNDQGFHSKQSADKRYNSCFSSFKSIKKYLKSVDRFSKRHKGYLSGNDLNKCLTDEDFSLMKEQTKEDIDNDYCSSYPVSVSRIISCNGEICKAEMYTKVIMTTAELHRGCFRINKGEADRHERSINETALEFRILRSREQLELSNFYATGDPTVLTNRRCDCANGNCDGRDNFGFNTDPRGLNVLSSVVTERSGCFGGGVTTFCTNNVLVPTNHFTVAKIRSTEFNYKFHSKTNSDESVDTWDGKLIKTIKVGLKTEILLVSRQIRTVINGFIIKQNVNNRLYLAPDAIVNDIRHYDTKKIGWNQLTSSGWNADLVQLSKDVTINPNNCADQTARVGIRSLSISSILNDRHSLDIVTGHKWNSYINRTAERNLLIFKDQVFTDPADNRNYVFSTSLPTYCLITPINIGGSVNAPSSGWVCTDYQWDGGQFYSLGYGTPAPIDILYVWCLSPSPINNALCQVTIQGTLGNITFTACTATCPLSVQSGCTIGTCYTGLSTLTLGTPQSSVVFNIYNNQSTVYQDYVLADAPVFHVERENNNNIVELVLKTEGEVTVRNSIACPKLNGRIDAEDHCFKIPVINGCGSEGTVFVRGDKIGAIESFSSTISTHNKFINVCPKKYPNAYMLRVTISGRDHSIHIDLNVNADVIDDDDEDDEPNCGFFCRIYNWILYIFGISTFMSYYYYNAYFLIIIVPIVLIFFAISTMIGGKFISFILKLLGFMYAASWIDYITDLIVYIFILPICLVIELIKFIGFIFKELVIKTKTGIKHEIMMLKEEDQKRLKELKQYDVSNEENVKIIPKNKVRVIN